MQSRHTPQPFENAWVSVVTALWMIPLAVFLLRVAFPPIVSVPMLLAFIAAIGILAVAGYHIPSWYWRFSVPSLSFYRRIGVRTFGRFVLKGQLWNRFFAKTTEINVSSYRVRIPDLRRSSERSERVHSAALASSLPFIALALLTDQPRWAMYVAVANIPFNIYPILLQQYTRLRARESTTSPKKDGCSEQDPTDMK
jgi:hypothetical protein